MCTRAGRRPSAVTEMGAALLIGQPIGCGPRSPALSFSRSTVLWGSDQRRGRGRFPVVARGAIESTATSSHRAALWQDGLPSRGPHCLGWSLLAARWLLCAHGFQPLSIRLNGPIQGHSCAAETLAAWTQSAERGTAGPAQENAPARPASSSPRLCVGAGAQEHPEGRQWTATGVHSSCVLGAPEWAGTPCCRVGV